MFSYSISSTVKVTYTILLCHIALSNYKYTDKPLVKGAVCTNIIGLAGPFKKKKRNLKANLRQFGSHDFHVRK